MNSLLRSAVPLLRNSIIYSSLKRSSTSTGNLLSGFRVKNSLSVGNILKDVALAKDSSLTWYSCGPTVYDSSHMGHARTYVCTDIIRRIMVSNFGVNLNFAMGITDIDDKIINKGRSKGYTTWSEMTAMTRQLEDDFFFDMDRLNVQRPDAVLRVTEHMDEIVSYVKRLVDQGDAYVSEDGVYFSVSHMKGTYDQFGLNLGQGQSNVTEAAAITDASSSSSSSSDVLIPEPIVPDAPSHCKRDPRDFALWKLSKKINVAFGDSIDSSNQLEQPHWASPWGPGRPGWHIECSAMTQAYFGPHIDIHSGGVDLQFPHHTNEIAQCDAHNCCDHHSPGPDWVRLWMHTGHLHIEGRKMSKSLKNFISVQHYFDAGLSSAPGDDFRIFCLQHRYSASLNYAPIRIEEAAMYRIKVESLVNYLKVLLVAHSRSQGGSGVAFSRKSTAESKALLQFLQTTRIAVQQALSDDFDTPRTLKLLGDLVSDAAQYSMRTVESLDAEQPVADRVLHPVEPLLSTVHYVLQMLTLFGLKFPADFNLVKMLTTPAISRRRSVEGHTESLCDYSDLEGGSGNGSVSDDTIDSMMEFRSAVRQSGVLGLKQLKQQRKKIAAGDTSFDPVKELDVHLQSLLKHCDEARSNLERTLSIKIDDIAGDKSKWRRVK